MEQRLIDANVLIEHLNTNFYGDVIEEIKKFPTASPNEITPAKWLPYHYDFKIKDGEYGSGVKIIDDPEQTEWEEYWAREYVCSSCHGKNHATRFCPHCGKKMGCADDGAT